MNTPTPQEIISARTAAGHSQTTAAAVVCVKLRAWQYWEGGGREMPAGLWMLYMIRTGQHETIKISGDSA